MDSEHKDPGGGGSNRRQNGRDQGQQPASSGSQQTRQAGATSSQNRYEDNFNQWHQRMQGQMPDPFGPELSAQPAFSQSMQQQPGFSQSMQQQPAFGQSMHHQHQYGMPMQAPTAGFAPCCPTFQPMQFMGGHPPQLFMNVPPQQVYMPGGPPPHVFMNVPSVYMPGGPHAPPGLYQPEPAQFVMTEGSQSFIQQPPAIVSQGTSQQYSSHRGGSGYYRGGTHYRGRSNPRPANVTTTGYVNAVSQKRSPVRQPTEGERNEVNVNQLTALSERMTAAIKASTEEMEVASVVAYNTSGFSQADDAEQRTNEARDRLLEEAQIAEEVLQPMRELAAFEGRTLPTAYERTRVPMEKYAEQFKVDKVDYSPHVMEVDQLYTYITDELLERYPEAAQTLRYFNNYYKTYVPRYGKQRSEAVPYITVHEQMREAGLSERDGPATRALLRNVKNSIQTARAASSACRLSRQSPLAYLDDLMVQIKKLFAGSNKYNVANEDHFCSFLKEFYEYGTSNDAAFTKYIEWAREARTTARPTHELLTDPDWLDPEVLTDGRIKNADPQFFRKHKAEMVKTINLTKMKNDKSKFTEESKKDFMKGLVLTPNKLKYHQDKDNYERKTFTYCPNCVGLVDHYEPKHMDHKGGSICSALCRVCKIEHEAGYTCHELELLSYPIERTLKALHTYIADSDENGQPRHPVAYLSAATGTGKSTRAMEYVLNCTSYSMSILCCTPKREAAKNNYLFVAKRLNYRWEVCNAYLGAYRKAEASYWLLQQMYQYALSLGDAGSQSIRLSEVVRLMTTFEESLETLNQLEHQLELMMYTVAFVHGRTAGARSRSGNFAPHRNTLLYATDGFIGECPSLMDPFDMIVLDECHELTSARETICSIVRQMLIDREGTMHLKKRVLIMSATLLSSKDEDVRRSCAFDKLVAFFQPAVSLQILIPLEPFRKLRSFTITNIFAKDDEDPMHIKFATGYSPSHKELYKAVEEALFTQRAAVKTAVGSTTYCGSLVFVPRKEDCEFIVGKLREDHKCLAVPFHAGCSNSSHENIIFRPAVTQMHRIIVATNIAESSVTIPNLAYVIDSGLVIRNNFRPSHNADQIIMERISQSERIQRCGRTGRQCDGTVIHLCTLKQAQDCRTDVPSEVERSDLRVIAINYNRVADSLARATTGSPNEQNARRYSRLSLQWQYDCPIPTVVDPSEMERMLRDLWHLDMGKKDSEGGIRLTIKCLNQVGVKRLTPDGSLLHDWLSNMIESASQGSLNQEMPADLYSLARRFGSSTSLFNDEYGRPNAQRIALGHMKLKLPLREENNYRLGQSYTPLTFGDLELGMIIVRKLWNASRRNLKLFFGRLETTERTQFLERYCMNAETFVQILRDWEREAKVEIPSFLPTVFDGAAFRTFQYIVPELNSGAIQTVDRAVLYLARFYYTQIMNARAQPLSLHKNCQRTAQGSHMYRARYRPVGHVTGNYTVAENVHLFPRAYIPGESTLFHRQLVVDDRQSIGKETKDLRERVGDKSKAGRVHLPLAHLTFESVVMFGTAAQLILPMEMSPWFLSKSSLELLNRKNVAHPHFALQRENLMQKRSSDEESD